MVLSEEMVNDFNLFFNDFRKDDILYVRIDLKNKEIRKNEKFIVLAKTEKKILLANKINDKLFYYTLTPNSFSNGKITFFKSNLINKKIQIEDNETTLTNVVGISVIRNKKTIKNLFGVKVDSETDDLTNDNKDTDSNMSKEEESSLNVVKTQLFLSSEEDQIITIYDSDEKVNFYFKIIEKVDKDLLLLFIGGENGVKTPLDMYKNNENKLFVLSKSDVDYDNGSLNIKLKLRGGLNEMVSNSNGEIIFKVNKNSDVSVINQTSDDDFNFTQDELRDKNLKSGDFRKAIDTKQSVGNKLKSKLLNKLGIVTNGSGDNLGLLKAKSVSNKTGLTKHGHPFVSKKNKRVSIIINEIENSMTKIDFSVLKGTQGVPSIFKVEKGKKIEGKFIDDNTIVLLKGQALPKYQIKLEIKTFLGNDSFDGIIYLESKNNTASFSKMSDTEYKIKFTIEY